MNNQEVQGVIDRLYIQIDKANELFLNEKCGFSISKVLHISFDEEVVEPNVVSWTGNCCFLCGGQLVRTGTCETCQNCGEMSGGCS